MTPTTKKESNARDLPQSARLRPQRGFSLFEALVTVVIISIGLLGLAGLQFAGVRAVNEAYEHTVAIHYTQDIVERLRANRAGVNAGRYNDVDLTKESDVQSCAESACDCTQNECDNLQLFNFDLYQWYSFIQPASGAGILPNLEIRIQRGTAAFTVTLTWGDSNAPHTLSTQTHLLL